MNLALFTGIIVLALLFGMVNGFTNGGSLVSTVITTRTLEPFGALCLVACGEVLGLFLLGQMVAHTLAHDLVKFPMTASPQQILGVLVSAFLGALVWTTGMWYVALPNSSSHALVGGIVGSVFAVYGSKAVAWPIFAKIFIFLGAVPVIALLLGLLLSRLVYWAGEYLTPAAGGFFRFLEILALSGVALVHGSNDGQKCLAMVAMGLAGLASGPAAEQKMPWSVVLLCGGAMAMGVIFGSRRIIRTLGKRLYRVAPLQAFCAETSTVLLVGVSSLLGFPMSTSQVMSTSVLGAGIALNPRDVRWNLVGEIGLAWLVTVPAAAALAAAFAWIAERALGSL